MGEKKEFSQKAAFGKSHPFCLQPSFPNTHRHTGVFTASFIYTTYLNPIFMAPQAKMPLCANVQVFSLCGVRQTCMQHCTSFYLFVLLVVCVSTVHFV
jgi:hypothetical protein